MSTGMSLQTHQNLPATCGLCTRRNDLFSDDMEEFGSGMIVNHRHKILDHQQLEDRLACVEDAVPHL